MYVNVLKFRSYQAGPFMNKKFKMAIKILNEIASKPHHMDFGVADVRKLISEINRVNLYVMASLGKMG